RPCAAASAGQPSGRRPAEGHARLRLGGKLLSSVAGARRLPAALAGIVPFLVQPGIACRASYRRPAIPLHGARLGGVPRAGPWRLSGVLRPLDHRCQDPHMKRFLIAFSAVGREQGTLSPYRAGVQGAESGTGPLLAIWASRKVA